MGRAEMFLDLKKGSPPELPVKEKNPSAPIIPTPPAPRILPQPPRPTSRRRLPGSGAPLTTGASRRFPTAPACFPPPLNSGHLPPPRCRAGSRRWATSSRRRARSRHRWATSSRRRARPVRRRTTTALRRTGQPLPCRSVQPRRPTRSTVSPGFQSNPPTRATKFLHPSRLLPGPPPARSLWHVAAQHIDACKTYLQPCVSVTTMTNQLVLFCRSNSHDSF
nr:ESX-1 secretion-associated protein EspI isoform X1 [Aegilops tauschii subsp. strangulata]XP_040243912.1 ESX-1 secretion-associated protein EspI isoform X1 [Aegilops tauschii subsp. strangulata]XP_040243916.1 ESX-1 secretion-associated protein EspI isoform X1 [Aegilops tauschii subsp. strangulata]XP_045083952.1 ESX-1 secretion-associated protein EspI isoform X1 [Aegilops tauschii subsp. strangulata]XP_045083954.1 ESX-1 secretion-associated protein EspI isoform X1 [Aegilops tauschii subsp. str